MSAVMLPVIEETPTRSRARVLLSGVKATLKSVAVKLDPSWHELSELDWIIRSAEEAVVNARAARAPTKGESCSLMVLCCGAMM